jgi:2,4-dienoyl-CoA reductase-like NADH-dependent reductase (Old Yellow Enzyme family)
MSILFTPFKLGKLEIKNRFVFSACEDNLYNEDGTTTEAGLTKYETTAKGEVGLIISGHLAVHPKGQARPRQGSIFYDKAIPGLTALTERVHNNGGKILFQIGYSVEGTHSANPEKDVADMQMVNNLSDAEIREIIDAFKSAAQRAVKANADGIQLHAAHGYILCRFLSPFFNQRTDQWGGSEENRFRLLKEIITAIQPVLPDGMPLLVKMNGNDFMGEKGVTPEMAVRYAGMLANLKVDGVEVSSGVSGFTQWNMVRGTIPMDDILRTIDKVSKKTAVELRLKNIAKDVSLIEGYNLNTTKMMRSVTGNMPVFAVGGWRSLDVMEKAVSDGGTDLISMCRPFIREPKLVRKFTDLKSKVATCYSCNRCLLAVAGNLDVRCYYKGLPA